MTAPASASGRPVPAGKPPTIYDVAQVAGVSHQSVSRYMRGLTVRESTKTLIERALTDLPYRPNLAARALITGRSHRIGALTHEISNVGPSLILEGATVAAREAGYLLDVLTLDMGDESELRDALASLLQTAPAGVLAFASTDSTRAVFEGTDFVVPTLIAAEEETDEDASGLGDVIDHLLELGHRSMAHIAGPETWSAARNRRHTFEAALGRRGLMPHAVVHGDWSARSGYHAVLALHESAQLDGVTAVVAANDQMALGAMHALFEMGRQVPGDISVTGVDDTPEAAYYRPALTTVSLDFRAQGRHAFIALLGRMRAQRPAVEEGTAPALSEPVPPPVPQLMIRESSGIAPRTEGSHITRW